MNKEELNETLKIIHEPITVNSIEYKYFDVDNYNKLVNVIDYCHYLYDKVRPYVEAQDKEIERLKNGYCELKVKCNNGECDCTNEEYDGMVQANMKLSLEVERLNNIITRIDSFVNRTIEVIEQQPSGKDEWILERLNGIKYLAELKENKDGNVS